MNRPIEPFSDTLAATAETLVTIATYTLRHEYPYIQLSLSSAGGSVIALDKFACQVQSAIGGAWETYIDDWSSVVANILLWKSGTLNTLAHAGADSARVYLGPVYAVRFQSAQAGVTASAVTITLKGAYTKNG